MRGYLHGYLHGRLFSTPEKEKRLNCFSSSGDCFWSRGLDSNQRPSGYEPDELPDCSTPQFLETKLSMLLGYEPDELPDCSTPQCRCLPIAYKQNRQERILHCADDTSKSNHGNSHNAHKQAIQAAVFAVAREQRMRLLCTSSQICLQKTVDLGRSAQKKIATGCKRE